MSALDQAIIKAYAKDRPVVSAVAPPSFQPVRSRPSPPASSSAVEEIYRDGSLYRLHGQSTAASITAPHVPPLPPTSPRRNVRRSLLRLMAANDRAETSTSPESPPPRVARKVIIRHVTHSAVAPPLGLLRAGLAQTSPPLADLLPETFVEEQDDVKQPSPIKPAPAKPAPVIPAPVIPAPQAAPLNVALEIAPPIDIAGRWLHEASIAPMVIVADGLAAKMHPAFVQHLVHVDALAASEISRATENQAPKDAAPTVAPRGKNTLDLRSAEEASERDVQSRVKVYIDAAHPHGRHRPHAHFRAESKEVVAPPTSEAAAEFVNQPLPISAKAAEIEGISPTPPAVPDGQATKSSKSADELPFNGALEQALASDLILVEPVAGSQEAGVGNQETGDREPATGAGSAFAEPAAVAASTQPVWEVDRFHWPRTCEKLLADNEGYLATAGDKLLAAVQDGLKVLAITGTRRGEGRSTLSLCLARSAARSGINVAIMDCDFLRPQIASKLGLETAFGWQDAALGKIPLSEAAVKSLADGITVMPLESAPVTRRLSLADSRVTATIRAAAATFELLILDLGPSGPGQQVLFPRGESCPLDAAIVVRDLRFTGADEAEAVGEMLHAAGIEAVGVAENFVVEEEVPATSV